MKKFKFLCVYLLLIYPSASFSEDIQTIYNNCKTMNHVKWDKYTRELIGKRVTGTMKLDSILGGGQGLSLFNRYYKKLIGAYSLSFSKGSISLNASELDEDQVIDLNEGSFYNVNYRIEYISYREEWAGKENKCVSISAKS